MKVLLTSGGTRTPIDSVRHVGNMSSGTFGEHLCKAFLKDGHDVTFLYAKGSKCPHEFRVDLSEARIYPDGESQAALASSVDLAVMDRIGFLAEHRELYHPFAYADFEDYAEQLFRLIGRVRPDVVVLAAAVSDYAPVKAEGKISSELDAMTIRLEKTPKLIRKVKEFLPGCFLVGFKLLVNSTQEQLAAAMADQMAKARTDMVVGNDLRDIKAAQHKLTLLSIDGELNEYGPMPGGQLAQALVEEIIRDAKTLNGDFAHLGAPGRKEAE